MDFGFWSWDFGFILMRLGFGLEFWVGFCVGFRVEFWVVFKAGTSLSLRYVEL